MPIRSLRAVAGAAVVTALATACQPLPAPPTAALPVSSATATAPAPLTQKAQLLAAINQARADAGVAPLRLREEVATVARRWAARLAAEGVLRHRPDLHEALLAEGLRPTYWAENVGRGGHVTQVHEAFMASPSHRANELDARFTEVGIGAVADGGQVWVVVDFTG